MAYTPPPRILITSALPYINGIKHLGNLAGSMLPADVYARYNRLVGNEVLFICATDEHGTPAELAAKAAGVNVKTYCDEQHQIQKNACAAFSVSFDWFGRSSSKANHELTQQFCEALDQNGYIEERTDKMIYSIDDQRFLPDRYVQGECPHCHYPKARGDQCDDCGRQIEPKDLINPYSTVSGSRNLEVRETKHLYLLQSKLADDIRTWVDTHPEWSSLVKGIAHKQLDEGLLDRGITRDLDWGIPVMKDGAVRPGYENKVFYVWFDAPIEYIAATKEYFESVGRSATRDWEKWWKTEGPPHLGTWPQVKYVQFMGKDNVPFHAANFPATIIGSGEPWKLVDTIKGLNWLNWGGEQFSTSEKRGLFMDTALELYDADLWRWYLISNAPEGSDTSFTWEQFQISVNKDLADTLGNFVQRVMKFGEGKFGLGGVAFQSNDTPLETQLYADIDSALAEIKSHYEAMEMRKVTQALKDFWIIGNTYIQTAAPWTEHKNGNVDRAAYILHCCLKLIRLYALTLEPIMPKTARAMSYFVADSTRFEWPDNASGTPILSIKESYILFDKISDERLAELKALYPVASLSSHISASGSLLTLEVEA